MNTEAARVLRRASDYIQNQLKSKESFYPLLKSWWNTMDHKTRGKFKKSLVKVVKEKSMDKNSLNTRVTDMFLCRPVTKVVFTLTNFQKWSKLMEKNQNKIRHARKAYQKHYEKSNVY